MDLQIGLMVSSAGFILALLLTLTILLRAATRNTAYQPAWERVWLRIAPLVLVGIFLLIFAMGLNLWLGS
jgi:cytochrome b561